MTTARWGAYKDNRILELTVIAVVLCGCLLCSSPAAAQSSADEARIKALVPYSQMLAQQPGLTMEQYNAAVRDVARTRPFTSPTFGQPSPSQQYLGRLSSNTYDPDAVSNPYGTYGSPYSANSINNQYGRYGSAYSPTSVNNPYATSAPKLYGQDGQYLGRLSSNPYDPESVANPYGRYGSQYSPTSINNPYSKYGSPFSALSPTNPYSLQSPVIVVEDP